MMEQNVSVVIPTKGRSALVARAVRSVIRQTYAVFEIIVVIDGFDTETEQELSLIECNLIKVILLQGSVGAAEARNVGVQASQGEWVAFLDDDDEWLPDKVGEQMKLALSHKSTQLVISCQTLERKPTGDSVLATEIPKQDQSVASYLFERRTPFMSGAQMQTSTLLTSRTLLLRVPFRKIQRHQDWDWLLRASREPGFKFQMVSRPLVIWYAEEDRHRISTRIKPGTYQFSRAWIAGYRDLVSKRAYADFLLTAATDVARRGDNRRACIELLFEAFRHGQPSFWALVAWLSISLFPHDIRHTLRNLIRPRRDSGASV